MKADTDLSTVIRPAMAGRIGGAFVTAWAGGLSIFMLGAASIVIMDGHIESGTFLVAIAGAMAILTRYVFRDVGAKWRWRVTIRADALDLDLPRGRSLIHRLDPVRKEVPHIHIEAIETRLEAYRSFGMASMHRSYDLKLEAGNLIVLGEDRALGTTMASTFFGDTVSVKGATKNNPLIRRRQFLTRRLSPTGVCFVMREGALPASDCGE